MLINFFCLVGTLHDLAVGYSSFLVVHYKWGVREPLDFMNITSLCVGAWPSEPWKRIFKLREENFLSVHKYTVYERFSYNSNFLFLITLDYQSLYPTYYQNIHNSVNLSLVHTFPSPNPTIYGLACVNLIKNQLFLFTFLGDSAYPIVLSSLGL